MTLPNEIEWVLPWMSVTDAADALGAELRKEVSRRHVLYGRDCVAIARRVDCDDVLFQLDDGAFAVVHLTFFGEQDRYSDFPWTRIFPSIGEFVEKVMIPDARGDVR